MIGYILFVLCASLYAVESVHIEIEPKHKIVFPGQNITILCRAGVPLSYCRITLPGVPSSLNLNAKSRYHREYNYFGTGLENGQCGVNLPSVTEKFNGAVTCSVATEEESAEWQANMTLVVAKSPSSPEMDVSPSNNRNNDYREGEVIRATCLIKDGRPPANITWYMDDEVIREGVSQPTVIVQNNLHTILQNLSRTLSWRDNMRTLKCVGGHVAYGSKKNTTSKNLLVRYAPRDVPMPIEQFGFVIGQTGDVVVEILANPQPQFTWMIGNSRIQEGDRDAAGKYEATQAEFLGAGKWKAMLFINDVTVEDVASEYFLKAKNQEGEKTYRVVISTSSQPEVLQLGVGAIVGIVAGILVLLLIIILVAFARATGRWCFAAANTDEESAATTNPKDPRESSDTESADHHGTLEKKTKQSGKAYLIYFFKKKNDKVSADPEDVRALAADEEKDAALDVAQETADGDGKKDVVYAELDLQSRAVNVSVVRPDDDKTEYAEIIHSKTEEKQ